MVVWGRKWLTGGLREERFGGRWQTLEGEYDTQRSTTGLYERVVIPTVVYSSEMLSLSAQERRKIEVFEEHVWHKESGQSEKRNNTRGVRV